MKTLDEHKTDLIEAVLAANLPRDVAVICLDILYERATVKTVERARRCLPEHYQAYDLVRLVAGTNPRFAHQIFWEALPMIEAAVHDHFISSSEDIARWHESLA
jgi:hypothetical protein